LVIVIGFAFFNVHYN